MEKGGEVILKVVNASAEEQTAEVRLNGIKKVQGPATAIVLTSESPTDENTLENPTRVVPVTKTVEISGPNFTYTFRPNSLTIFRLGGVK